jgi:hypothetical protein
VGLTKPVQWCTRPRPQRPGTWSFAGLGHRTIRWCTRPLVRPKLDVSGIIFAIHRTLNSVGPVCTRPPLQRLSPMGIDDQWLADVTRRSGATQLRKGAIKISGVGLRDLVRCALNQSYVPATRKVFLAS